MNLDKQIKDMEKEHNVGGDSEWMNIVEGANKLRLVTELAVLPQWWDGAKYHVAVEGDKRPESTTVSIKWLGWVIDRSDGEQGKLKLIKLPHTVAKQIRDLQQSEDYSFEEAPMPYDVTVNAKGAGTKEVEYSTMPSPKREDVPEDVLKVLGKKSTPESVVNAMKNKRGRELGLVEEKTSEVDYPEDDLGEPKF